MAFSGSKPIRLGVVFLLALLIVNGLLSFRAVRILRQRRIATRHIYDAHQVVEQIFSSVKDAETGQRGYLYTGDERYLEPYNKAVPRIRQLITGLNGPNLGDASPELEQELIRLIDQKLGELDRTISLRRSGNPAEVRALVDAGKGMELMDSIRSVIAKMEAEQEQHLRLATEKQQEADSYLVATLAFATGTAFMFVLLFAAAINREARRLIELQKAEKLATTGRMAATVAHEINNPLEAATNLIYLAQTDSGVPESVKNLLDLADRELSRVAHMTKQTLGFYRSATQAETFAMSELVEEVVRLFDSKLQGKSLTVRRDFQSARPLVGNRGEIFQVITNIFSNAIDASFNGGVISVTVAEVQGGVGITVEDDGVGIPKEVQDKMFQAFMTTKKDVGTGLGLWVSERLVAKHGGRIAVKSLAAGRKGSLFKIWLPYGSDLQADRSAASLGT